uniref:Uncharacterized protein n=1 Tax=Leersia perrieri TaxID=77586 RepID=A0A0D9V920_9ORYZ
MNLRASPPIAGAAHRRSPLRPSSPIGHPSAAMDDPRSSGDEVKNPGAEAVDTRRAMGRRVLRVLRLASAAPIAIAGARSGLLTEYMEEMFAATESFRDAFDQDDDGCRAASRTDAEAAVALSLAAGQVADAALKLSRAADSVDWELLCTQAVDTEDSMLKKTDYERRSRGWISQLACWWLSRKDPNAARDVENQLSIVMPGQAESPPRQANDPSTLISMLDFSLSSSLNLIPFMDLSTILKDRKPNELWWIAFALEWWFGMTSVGIPSAVYGLTMLVIFYIYLLLGIGDKAFLGVTLVFFTVLHCYFLIKGLRKRNH